MDKLNLKFGYIITTPFNSRKFTHILAIYPPPMLNIVKQLLYTIPILISDSSSAPSRPERNEMIKEGASNLSDSVKQ
ncbi:hypothetical protein ED551_10680 [Muribaculaceae bacterium Isolate-013 (NCI)]|nr:hypothetical protein ED551_10680 [Muribaculaceae bacterium Isolate-013 (NCI)]